MVLRVVADESDQPLAGIAIHAEFIIIPDSDHATFLTSAEGAARITLPANGLVGMNLWVSAAGRVPTSVVWNRLSVGSLVPDWSWPRLKAKR